MLVFDFRTIGNRLLDIRRRAGLTQAEAAEAAGLSDRTYADIERGTVNMRLETLLRICQALHITPDELLNEPKEVPASQRTDVLARLDACPLRIQQAALQLLDIYMRSHDI